jgi:FkbM family methyltransferase
MSGGWLPLDAARWRADADAAPDATPRPPGALQKALIALCRATPLHRGAMRPAMSRLVMALGGNKPFDTEFRSVRFRIRGSRNLIEQGVLLHPRYNAADIDFLMPAARDGVFVDIGSNIGLYSLALARVAARVVAVDANPQMAEQLRTNAAISGIRNVTMVNSAVSDETGRANLAIRLDDEAIVRIEEAQTGAIPVTTLALLLQTCGVETIGALKIDIEGHEDKALGPFLETAPDALLPRRIVIETAGDGDDYPRCKAALRQRGYQPAGRSRQNSFFERR